MTEPEPPDAPPIRHGQWLVYDQSTGRILHHVSGRHVSPPDGKGLVSDTAHHDGAHWYVVEGAVMPRPDCPINLRYTSDPGVLVLAGLPIGAVVHISGDATAKVVAEDPDGMVELTFRAKGTYRLTCEVFPMREFVATVST